MKKRILSIVLCLVMLVSLMPMGVLAAGSSTAPEKIYICGMELTDGKCLVSNDATVTDYTSGNYVALYKDGVLYLNGLDKTYSGAGADANQRALGWKYSIGGAHDLVIELVEGSVNKLEDPGQAAIAGTNGTGSGPSLTIQGKGTLNVTGGTSAIWVWEDVVVQNGATVNVFANGSTSKQAGICTNESGHGLTIKQGTTVTIYGKNYGVSADNSATGLFEVLGGNLVIKGENAALNKLASNFGGNTVYVSNDISGADATVWDGSTALTSYKYISLSGFSSSVTTYDISKAATENGSFEVDYAKSMADETVTITAIPDDGYEVDAVTVTDADTQPVTVNGTGNTRSFTMPAKNVTVAVTFKAVAPVVPTTTARSHPEGGNVFLGNDKMELGINEYGSFGTTVNAPSNFHPWSGAYNKIGLVSYPWGDARDYFLPGTVDEGFVFFWNGSMQAYVKSSDIGEVSSNGYVKSADGTVNNSSGNLLSATTTGTANGKLAYSQNISFKDDEGFATVTITLKNNSSDTLSGVEFIRGFDPDQGKSSASTSNYYHTDSDGTVWIVATPTNKSGEFTSVEDFASGITAPFIFKAPKSNYYTVVPVHQKVGWGSYSAFTDVTATTSPYKLNASVYDDEGIGLKFMCGNIGHGETVTITYLMSLDSDVAGAIAALKGGGISSATGSVELELSAEASEIVVFVNGTELDKSAYTIDKTTNPLKPVITFLAAAGLTHTSVITAEVTLIGATAAQTVAIKNNIPAPTTFTVTWKNGDTVLDTDEVAVGDTPAYTGTTPTKDATAQYTYTFSGWDPAITAVTGDVTYTAQFSSTVNKYDIGWDTDGDGDVDDTVKVAYGEVPTHADGSKAADAQYTYTFSGWDPAIVAVTGEATYTAQFTATPNTYSVTLVPNGGTIKSGDVTEYTYGVGAALPDEVVRFGYRFEGWYANENCTGPEVTEIGVTETGNKTYYAKWYQYQIIHTCTSVCPVCGGCTNDSCDDVACEDKCILPHGFTDVAEGKWYSDAVEYAYHHKLVDGIGNGLFGVKHDTTRAMIVTVLWRAAGCPEAESAGCPFTDVDMDSYYAKAVLWAAENGVTIGTSATTFSPDEVCTRAQMVALLYRLSGAKASGEPSFSDVPAGAYYAEAVNWAIENGITTGTGGNRFSPDAPCSRAEMVTFIYRYFAD